MSNRTAEPQTHSTTGHAARVTAIVQTAYGDAGVGSDGAHRAPQDHLVADQALAAATTHAILDVITSVGTARALVR